MRPDADAQRVRALVRDLSGHARVRVRLSLTGGATAVLEGWRSAMIDGGHVVPARLRTLFAEIEDDLHRYPRIDPAAFRARVERFVQEDPTPP